MNAFALENGAAAPAAGTVLYAVLYLLTLVPGLPLGWRFFGRSTPLGWIAGALMGYAMSALAFWVPAWMGFPRPLAIFMAWLVVTVPGWRLTQNHTSALVTLPDWSPRDTTRWLALMLLVTVLVVVPFSRVGETDANGTRRYRAYFTADFVWHM
ncbi:MAG: hypothetical protein ABIP90_10215, partial [Vicinamibacterales bacterium]